MSNKYLDEKGVDTLWKAVKTEISTISEAAGTTTASLWTTLSAAKTVFNSMSSDSVKMLVYYKALESKGTLDAETGRWLIGVEKEIGMSSGDIIMICKNSILNLAGAHGFILHTQDAKAAEGSFPGADGLESIWDKTQVNKVPNIESNANLALARADRGLFGHLNPGSYNMNNESEAGQYATANLGRPPGSDDGEEYFFMNTPKRKYDNGYSDFVQIAISKNDPSKIFVRQISWNDGNNSLSTILNDWQRVGGDQENVLKKTAQTLTGDEKIQVMNNIGIQGAMKSLEFNFSNDEYAIIEETEVDGEEKTTIIPYANKIQGGFISKADKAKLDDLAARVNLYHDSYGIIIDENVASPALTRVGNMELHKTLPVQSLMRRCLLADDGTVIGYLDPNDSTKMEDGTDADLSGANGMVMVEIPRHWRKCTTSDGKTEVRISLNPIADGVEVPKMYRSAYEATIDRTISGTPKLASVVNETAAFRGGNGSQISWDGTYRSQLGKPATVVSLTNFRKYARNRGAAGLYGAGWNCDLYEIQKACYWLYIIEYANLNCQAAYNAQPTSEGYKQGGLGNGVTTISGDNWSTFNGYYPLVPCGITNELGNRTGVVDYSIDNEAGIKATFQVPSYRGIENPFGHVWSWTDGCKFAIQSEDDGGKSLFYVCTDPSKYQDSNYNDYEQRGELPRKNGYIKRMMVGQHGENMPTEVGAGSTTYFCDYFYTNIPASGTAQRGVLFGGAATNDAYAGLSYTDANSAASSANTRIGSRLCFIPE